MSGGVPVARYRVSEEDKRLLTPEADAPPAVRVNRLASGVWTFAVTAVARGTGIEALRAAKEEALTVARELHDDLGVPEVP
jgi:hypothetical protein